MSAATIHIVRVAAGRVEAQVIEPGNQPISFTVPASACRDRHQTRDALLRAAAEALAAAHCENQARTYVQELGELTLDVSDPLVEPTALRWEGTVLRGRLAGPALLRCGTRELIAQPNKFGEFSIDFGEQAAESVELRPVGRDGHHGAPVITRRAFQ